MQKTATKAKSSRSYTRPAQQKSTTLSRKYVRRPGQTKSTTVSKSASASVKTASAKATKAPEAKKTTKVEVTAAKAAEKAPATSFKTTAKASDLKKAISSSAEKAPALAKVEKAKKAEKVAKAAKKPRLFASDKTPKQTAKTSDAARNAMRSVATMETAKPLKAHRGRRIALAFACSALAVGALAVFVHLNMPNISVKVAAMQTGIDASYPDFVPRGYSYETISSDKNGKVTMTFAGPDGASFVLTEEKSTWDSATVQSNYVRQNYSSNYSTMHEQGITYFTESGSAVWVNGGILYKLTSSGKTLSKEQIRNIVVSL